MIELVLCHALTSLDPSLEGDIVKGKDRKQNTVTQRYRALSLL